MELKPCPFCGSTVIWNLEVGRNTDMWFVQCQDCFATFPHFDSEEEAIEAWNRRVDNPRLGIADGKNSVGSTRKGVEEDA